MTEIYNNIDSRRPLGGLFAAVRKHSDAGARVAIWRDILARQGDVSI